MAFYTTLKRLYMYLVNRASYQILHETLPHGDYVFQIFLEFGIEGHFRRENLTSFLVG